MSDKPEVQSDAEKLRVRNRELLILNSIAEALNRSVDLGEALQIALAQATELLDLHTGWVWLLDEETGDSYLAAAQGLPPALSSDPRRMEGACYCLDTYRMGDLSGAANVNVVTCSRLKTLVDGTDGLRYHASIPLYANEKKLGVLNVASPDWRELSADDLRLLHTVGDLLSISIERARLFDKSTQLGALEERNRLAREIHDTLAQGLTAVALKLESADAWLQDRMDVEKAQDNVRQALALTRLNLDEARRSVLDLRAAPLDGRTLDQALQELAQEQAKEVGFELKFESVGGRPLPIRVEVGLFRIAQEAISNVARHAAAAEVYVGIVTLPAEVTLIVADDGLGFDASQVPADRFGLVGLNERVKLLGGQLQLESDPGMGTRLEANIPLKPFA
jgi:two-component system NarL family sensor kinase